MSVQMIELEEVIMVETDDESLEVAGGGIFTGSNQGTNVYTTCSP